MNAESDEVNSVDIDKIATEYNALRDEILKRIGLRQQFASMTLTVAGVFLGIGVTTDTIALVYPLLATLLAISWAQNDLRIRQLAKYVRERLESRTAYLRWETTVQEVRDQTRVRAWRFVLLSHGGIFIFTQVAAIGIGLLKFTFTPVEWVLLGIDIVAILLTIWAVGQAR